MKKIFLIISVLFITFNFFGTDYYICLGSFLNQNNLSFFSKSLNDSGISTIFEKTSINGKVFTRIIYNKKYTTIGTARIDLQKIKNNPIIKKYNIKDIWIRSGQIEPASIITENKNETLVASKEIKKEVKKPDLVVEVKKEDVKTLTPEKKENDNIGKAEIKPEIKQNVIETSSEKSKFFLLNKNGSGNILFSDKIIELNKEDEKQFKNTFSKPEKIFARCYFSNSIGKTEVGDFWHELWLNDEFKTKVIFDSVPDSNWNQIQIWISEEDYKIDLDNLPKGEYKLKLNVYKKDSTTQKSIMLASGEITYIVNL